MAESAVIFELNAIKDEPLQFDEYVLLVLNPHLEVLDGVRCFDIHVDDPPSVCLNMDRDPSVECLVRFGKRKRRRRPNWLSRTCLGAAEA